MSTNNEIIIYKDSHKKPFAVYENFCVDNDFEPSGNPIKRLKTLKDAIKYANEYCATEIVEYGYHIDNSCLK